MRIAQIAPLYESCPPQLYGGTERVVSFLTEELVRMGHEVTLFASGDSQTSARLVPACPRALRLEACRDPLAYHMIMLHQVMQMADRFDMLHFHTDYLHFPLMANSGRSYVTTLHGRQDLADLVPVYHAFSQVPLISISDSQRGPLPHANWIQTIHHGLPSDMIRPGKGDGGYVAFVGRISPEKRLDRAIRIAQEAGIPLRIAAKVDRADKAYFESEIAPLLDGPGITFVGEINDLQKSDFFGQARALLFPIDWPEPFGLVMIEAMAAGTPVLAFRAGSVPEVLEDGVTGCIVDTMDEAMARLPEVLALDRQRVRSVFDSRFSAARMARDYVSVYEDLIGARTVRELVPRVAALKATSERMSVPRLAGFPIKPGSGSAIA
jgi:glycosyltransferase involved in cell wall biosynthesis